MRKKVILFLFICISPFTLFADAIGEVKTPEPISQSNTPSAPFQAFTGKITRNKVRLRLQPSLESTILREFEKGDLILATGDAGDFYSIKAPETIKSYIFRTFVLDNTVEGKHVNVRLYPDLEAPVIAQLNSGDPVEGTISALNSKWLEIPTPDSARFYVCKDYVENIGPSSLFAKLQRQHREVQELLEHTQVLSETELEKPYDQMQLEAVFGNLKKIINNYPEFSVQVAKAQDLLKTIQDTALQKKLAYLESRVLSSTDALTPPQISSTPSPQKNSPLDGKIANWLHLEEGLYKTWLENNDNEATLDDFYEKQKQNALILTGIIEPYIRHIPNKPGDYLFLSRNTRMPVAYLYSTKVNLGEKSGQEVTIIAVPRPNNNFAHPAYFVLSVE